MALSRDKDQCLYIICMVASDWNWPPIIFVCETEFEIINLLSFQVAQTDSTGDWENQLWRANVLLGIQKDLLMNHTIAWLPTVLWWGKFYSKKKHCASLLPQILDIFSEVVFALLLSQLFRGIQVLAWNGPWAPFVAHCIGARSELKEGRLVTTKENGSRLVPGMRVPYIT